MLQIRLNRVSSSEGSGGPKSLPVETVTVACPDHLVIADLPVAKSIGSASTVSLVKTVGRRSRRHLGERVHFCVRCDFPIAIYGRLSPCEHAFCLDCARSDSSCYLCDERIQKIQTIKMMEGIFICAAPHCLKSFLKRSEFESHIHESHSNLLQSKTEKEDGNELDTFNVARASSTDSQVKQSIPADTSTARNQPRTGFSPSSNSQPYDLEEKAHRLQSREQTPAKPPIMQPKPPFYGRNQNYPQELPSDSNPAQVERPGPFSRFHQQQSYDTQAGPHHWCDSDQFPDKQQGIPSESPFPDYPPVHSSHNPSNFVGTSQGLAPPTFNHPPFPAEGAQPFQNAHYEVARPDLASESGSEQSSLLGYPIPPAGAANFPDNYPRPWNMGLGGMPFDQMPGGQGIPEGYTNPSDSQGRVGFFQGDYGRGPGGLPPNPPPMPPMSSKGLEPLQGGNTSDHKDGKGVLAPQPLPLPLPPPPPIPHVSHLKRGNFPHSGDAGWEGQSYGWQNEKHDRFGGGKD